MADVMANYDPITPERLVEVCADVAERGAGTRFVAVDGADAARPVDLADQVAARLAARGRAASVVAMADFLRPASLRLEYGHTDAESYRTLWFDHDAVQREVIDAIDERNSWLPRLWDADRDRSFRDRPPPAPADQVILLAGPLLLGSGLDVDVTVALVMSAGALRRHTPPAAAWTIAALVAAAEDAPAADIEVRYDHPDRPALCIRGRAG
ncbi:nucleoside/nucleotide kinase family protein [Gordonia mangrovi]|nr:hypothetical protein [Gordonia mangrovi]UVF77825.1 hypothetical protein NWF22_21640 [Gordonia mangrovi]